MKVLGELKQTLKHLLSEKSVTEKHLRNIAKTRLWGLTEVSQVIYFWKNLDIPNGILKTCIADTGYDHRHMDLTLAKPDAIGQNNQSIANEALFYDGSGHRTYVAEIVASA